MSTSAVLTCITAPASADLSTKQFTFVKLNSSGQTVTANASDTAQIGIQQDRPNAAGVPSNVAIEGVSKCKAGATVAAGAAVTSDANGAAITATTGKQIMGFAKIGGAANDLIEVIISPRGLA